MNSAILDRMTRLKLTNHYEEWTKAKKIIEVTFEITPKCNLDCVHCYMCNLKETREQLSYEQVIHILDILYDNGILFLTFSGGEPFLRKDFKDIYIYAKKKGFLIDIFSNGTMIDEEWIKILNEYPPLLIDLSIYGASNETYEKVTGRKGAFDKFMNTLELLKTANIRFSIKAPILTLNYNELEAMRSISEQYSKENFRFSYDVVPDRNNSLLPRRYELDPLNAVLLEIDDSFNVEALSQVGQEQNDWQRVKDKYGFMPVYFCSIGSLSAHIDYSGNVSACIECVEKHNIFDKDFESICTLFCRYKNIEANKDFRCIGCEAIGFCSSCPQVRKRQYGDEQIVTDYDCMVAKLKYKYYVENYSIDELKGYYKNLTKEVHNSEISKT